MPSGSLLRRARVCPLLRVLWRLPQGRWGGGGAKSGQSATGAPVDNGAPAAHADACAALQRAQAALTVLLAAEYRDRFELYPGKTYLCIPTTSASAKGFSGGGGGSMLPPAPEGDFTNDGSSFPTRFPFQIVSKAPREDVLTLCADSAASRREWILRIRAYLRPMASATPAWLLAHQDAVPAGAAVMSVSLFLRLLYLGDADSLGAVAALDDDNGEGGGDTTTTTCTATTTCSSSSTITNLFASTDAVSVLVVPSAAALSTLDEAIHMTAGSVGGGCEGKGNFAARNTNTASLVHDEYRSAILMQTRG